MTLLLSATVKVSLLVLGALTVTLVLRRRSAAARHWVLAVAFACGLALPLLELALPSWPLPIATPFAASSRSSVQLTSAPPISRDETAASPASGQATARPDETRSYSMLLGWLWTAGVLCGLTVLGTGMMRLRRLVHLSNPMLDERWNRAARDIAGEYGIRQPVTLLHSPHPSMVVTWGVMRSTVLLPNAAPAWTDGRIRAVLRHELAHVRRGDWLVMLGAALVRCLYWFNPLVWITFRRLRNEGERACDDLVLSADVSATEYATHLLEIARETASVRRNAAMALTHPSTLEGRIRAMLNTGLNRQPITSRARAVMLTLAVAVAAPLGVASLSARAPTADALVAVVPTDSRPAPPALPALPAGPAAPVVAAGQPPLEPPAPAAVVQARAAESARAKPGEIEGVLYDQFGGLLPGASVRLTQISSGARYDAATNPRGAFAIRSLPAGDYELATSLPGFVTVTNQIRLTDGAIVRRHIALPLGTLQETISVVCAAEANRREVPVRSASPSAGDNEPRVPALFTGGIGGQVKVPSKFVHIMPVCPQESPVASAVILLGGRIGIDGLLTDVHDVTPEGAADSSHRVYLASAVEAVSGWVFSPTLLNGAPVEANIRITISFSTAR